MHAAPLAGLLPGLRAFSGVVERERLDVAVDDGAATVDDDAILAVAALDAGGSVVGDAINSKPSKPWSTFTWSSPAPP